MLNIETLIGLSINGLFTGLGAAVGTYFGTRLFIKSLEKLENKILKKRNGTETNNLS